MRLLRCILTAALCAVMLASCSSRPENKVRPSSTVVQNENTYTVNGETDVTINDQHLIATVAGVELRLSAFGEQNFAIYAKNTADSDRTVRSCYVEADSVVYNHTSLSSGYLSPGEETTMSCSFPKDVSPSTLRMRFYALDENHNVDSGSLTDVIEVQRGGSDLLEPRFPAESIYSDENLDVMLTKYESSGDDARAELCLKNKTGQELFITRNSYFLEPDGLKGSIYCFVPADATAYTDLELTGSSLDLEALPYIKLELDGYKLEQYFGDDGGEPVFTTESIFIPLTTDDPKDASVPEADTDPQPTETVDDIKEYNAALGMSELIPLSVTLDGGEPSSEICDGKLKSEYVYTAFRDGEDNETGDMAVVYFKLTNLSDNRWEATSVSAVNGLSFPSNDLNPTIAANSADYIMAEIPLGGFDEVVGGVTDISIRLNFFCFSDGETASAGPFELEFSKEKHDFDPAENGKVIYEDDNATLYELAVRDRGYRVTVSLYAENKTDKALVLSLDEKSIDTESLWLVGAVCQLPAGKACYSEVHLVDLNGGTDVSTDMIKGHELEIALYDSDYNIVSEGEAKL